MIGVSDNVLFTPGFLSYIERHGSIEDCEGIGSLQQAQKKVDGKMDGDYRGIVHSKNDLAVHLLIGFNTLKGTVHSKNENYLIIYSLFQTFMSFFHKRRYLEECWHPSASIIGAKITIEVNGCQLEAFFEISSILFCCTQIGLEQVKGEYTMAEFSFLGGKKLTFVV